METEWKGEWNDAMIDGERETRKWKYKPECCGKTERWINFAMHAHQHHLENVFHSNNADKRVYSYNEHHRCHHRYDTIDDSWAICKLWEFQPMKPNREKRTHHVHFSSFSLIFTDSVLSLWFPLWLDLLLFMLLIARWHFLFQHLFLFRNTRTGWLQHVIFPIDHIWQCIR